MSKVLVPKKIMTDMKKRYEKKTSLSDLHKKHFTLLSILAVIVVSTSAMSWIGFMNIKQNGGKLPWE